MPRPAHGYRAFAGTTVVRVPGLSFRLSGAGRNPGGMRGVGCAGGLWGVRVVVVAAPHTWVPAYAGTTVKVREGVGGGGRLWW